MHPDSFKSKVKLMRDAQNDYFRLRKIHKPSDEECKDALKKSKALEAEVDKALNEVKEPSTDTGSNQEELVKPPSQNMQKPFFSNDYLGQ